jgi:hypothetical protein
MRHKSHRCNRSTVLTAVSLLVEHLLVLRKVFSLLPKAHRRISSALDMSLVLMFMNKRYIRFREADLHNASRYINLHPDTHKIAKSFFSFYIIT